MGSTEPPPTPARTHAHDDAPGLKRCAECGLPHDDGPFPSGTAGCPGCDPTLRLRAGRRPRRPGLEPSLEHAA